MLAGAQQELSRLEEATGDRSAPDNRERMNELYVDQRSARSRNVVKQLGTNWGYQVEQRATEKVGGKRQFSNQWLESNKLYNPTQVAQPEGESKESDDSQPDPFQVGGEVPRRPEGKTAPAGARVQFKGSRPARNQPQAQAPGAREDKAKAMLKDSLQRQGTADQEARRSQSRGEVVKRYQQKLQQQQEVQLGGIRRAPQVTAGQPVADGPLIAGGRGRAGGQAATPPADTGSPESRSVTVGVSAPGVFSADLDIESAAPAQAGGQVVTTGQPTGLASLDVELPLRGAVYRFTTPRGDVEITARSVSNDLMTRLAYALGIVVAVLLVRWLIHFARQGRFNWLNTRAGSTCLICFGLLALFTCIFPLLGLVALVAGVVIKIKT